MPNPSPKKGGEKAIKRKEPPFAEYHDEVTDAHLERIDTLVDQGQFKDSEKVSGPAW